MLDPYSKPLLAPLGIVFPFPMFCSKLDSYMKRESELSSYFTQNKGKNIFEQKIELKFFKRQKFLGAALSNQQFWLEWPSIECRISQSLKNLFDRIFVLLPSFRCTLRDIARHPWLLSRQQLTPDEITGHMKSRCPTGVHTNREASPRVVTGKLLGGVDQASLRLSLSANPSTPVYTHTHTLSHTNKQTHTHTNKHTHTPLSSPSPPSFR